MRNIVRISLGISVILLIAGCFDNSDESTPRSTAKDSVASEYLPIVVVNGINYSANDLELEVNLRKVLLSRLPKKKAMLTDLGIEKMRRQILNSVLSKLSIQAELKRVGVSASDSAIKLQEEKMSAPFRIKGETMDSFYKFLNEKGVYPTFKSIAAHEAGVNELLRLKYTNELEVTEAEIDRAMAHSRRYNENAQKKNSEIYSLASNIVLRASKGEDFSLLAKKYSVADKDEIENGGCLGEWDESDAKHIDSELWDKLNKLPEGGVSEVIETDVGLYIFKVNKRVTESEATGAFALNLSRIELHRVILYPEYKREEVKGLGLKQARSMCLKKELQTLFNNLDVKTPSGTNSMVKIILQPIMNKGGKR